MTCFFNEAICIPEIPWWFFALIVGCILLVVSLVIISAAQKGTSMPPDPVLGNDDQANVDPDPENEEEDDSPVKVGQKIFYDIHEKCECNLVVTAVDDEESEVVGYFTLDLPQGAETLGLHFDYDNNLIYFSLRTSDGGAKELIFSLEDPDVFDDYEIKVDYI